MTAIIGVLLAAAFVIWQTFRADPSDKAERLRRCDRAARRNKHRWHALAMRHWPHELDAAYGPAVTI